MSKNVLGFVVTKVFFLDMVSKGLKWSICIISYIWGILILAVEVGIEICLLFVPVGHWAVRNAMEFLHNAVEMGNLEILVIDFRPEVVAGWILKLNMFFFKFRYWLKKW